jgi:hypothetical protein
MAHVDSRQTFHTHTHIIATDTDSFALDGVYWMFAVNQDDVPTCGHSCCSPEKAQTEPRSRDIRQHITPCNCGAFLDLLLIISLSLSLSLINHADQLPNFAHFRRNDTRVEDCIDGTIFVTTQVPANGVSINPFYEVRCFHLSVVERSANSSIVGVKLHPYVQHEHRGRKALGLLFIRHLSIIRQLRSSWHPNTDRFLELTRQQ